MQKNIELLLNLQEKDIRIDGLKKDQIRLPQELNDAKNKVQEANDSIQAKKDEIMRIQVARKEMEGDIGVKQEEIQKYSTQLFQIKTNEEYKAMQKQIDDHRKECVLIEDKILDKMVEIENAQKELSELEGLLKKAEQALLEKEKEVSDRIGIIGKEVEDLEREREIMSKEIPPDFLKKYTRIFKNKQGAALVSVANDACQGCHMKLPPNVINETKKSDRLILCDNCARILYFSD